jgi:transposase
MVTEHLTPHDWKEWRRMQALHLMKQEGWKQRDIAVALDVTEGAVSRWLAVARREGAEALLSRPAPGPTPKLTPAQQRLIPDFLWHGAEAYGFRGELWTCARVVKVIQAFL